MYPDAQQALRNQSLFRAGGGKPCTYGGTVGFTTTFDAPSLGAEDLNQNSQSVYTVSIDVPSAELLPQTSTPSQTTLTATTDTGYRSSIVADMQFTGSHPSTAHSGYTTYNFELQPSSSVTGWASSVVQNTSVSLELTGTSTSIFSPQGIPGTYVVYATLSSSQLGSMPVVSTSYSDPGVQSNPGPCPNNNPCYIK